MRVPVARDAPVEQHDQTPAPAVSLLPGRKLAEPDAQFIKDIATVIRSGVRPLVGAQWLGISRKQWRRWRQRTGGLYDELRDAVRSATAHLEVKLMADLAKKSPGAALKGLRRVRDEDVEEPSRPYHVSGLYALRRKLPHLLDRVHDPAIPETALSPVESAARQFRDDLLADLGGRATVTTAKRALLRAVTGSWVLLSTVDTYLFELAGTTGVVNRRTRSVFTVVEQRARLADSLTRQLLALGLDRAAPKPVDLNTYIATKYGTSQHGDATPADTEKEP